MNRDKELQSATSSEELMPTAIVSSEIEASDIPDAPAISVIEPGPESDNITSKRKAPGTPLQESMKRLRRDIRAMISIGLLVFFVVIAVIGPPIYKSIGGPKHSDLQGTIGPAIYHDGGHQELTRQDEGPSAQYWLGTDYLGRDLLARLMQGLLISLTVAFLVEVVDIGLGVTIGVLAGYYGGWVDTILARFTDLVFAFPGLLLVILLVGIFGSTADDNFGKLPLIGTFLGNGNARLLIVSMTLALTVWPLMARYVRGLTLQLKQEQFVEAARTAGTSNTKIIMRHIIPNLFSIVFISATLNVAGTIIGEAGISLLGLGVQSPGSSLGLMISDTLDLIEVHPWETLFPTFVLAAIVLAISFIGDGLRDAFDPRSKDA